MKKLNKSTRKSTDTLVHKLIKNKVNDNKLIDKNINRNDDNNKRYVDEKQYLINGFIIKIFEEEHKITIRIGNKKYECIVLSIDKSSIYKAELDYFNYYKTCNITNDLERKKGNKLMMNTLINFIKLKYPVTKTIYLIDAAIYPCSANDTYKNTFSLYDYYLFKYGSSYYKYNYGFDFVDNNDLESHEENKQLISTFIIDKQKLGEYLFNKAKKTKITSYIQDVNNFLDNIKDNKLAVDFIKSYKFNDNTCYLMKFFFQFINENIPEYKTLSGCYCVFEIN